MLVELFVVEFERGELRAAPTLVIHGKDDTFLPIAHGRRLAAAIPSPSGLWLEDAGHPFPYPNMREVTKAITGHLDATDQGVSGSAHGRRD